MTQLGPDLEHPCRQCLLGTGWAGHRMQRIILYYHDPGSFQTVRREDEWLHLAEVRVEKCHLLHLRPIVHHLEIRIAVK